MTQILRFVHAHRTRAAHSIARPGAGIKTTAARKGENSLQVGYGKTKLRIHRKIHPPGVPYRRQPEMIYHAKNGGDVKN
jgi:hypothetical protein